MLDIQRRGGPADNLDKGHSRWCCWSGRVVWSEFAKLSEDIYITSMWMHLSYPHMQYDSGLYGDSCDVTPNLASTCHFASCMPDFTHHAHYSEHTHNAVISTLWHLQTEHHCLNHLCILHPTSGNPYQTVSVLALGVPPHSHTSTACFLSHVLDYTVLHKLRLVSVSNLASWPIRRLPLTLSWKNLHLLGNHGVGGPHPNPCYKQAYIVMGFSSRLQTSLSREHGCEWFVKWSQCTSGLMHDTSVWMHTMHISTCNQHISEKNRVSCCETVWQMCAMSTAALFV